MAGVKDIQLGLTWFQETFGFKESQDATVPASSIDGGVGSRVQVRRQYTTTRGQFRYTEGVLEARAIGAKFHVGPFELATVEDLLKRVGEARKANAASETEPSRLTFRHIVGSFYDLHLDVENAGAVFQVASMFNCLQTSPSNVEPEDGVTRYALEASQGSACAISCPAATVFRNYFANGGQAGGSEQQIDCLSEVAALLCNEGEPGWRLHNGHCLPVDAGSLPRVARRLRRDKADRQAAAVRGRVDDGGLTWRSTEKLKVGIHWDTDVFGGSHRVCQVFCSACPVGLVKKVKSTDWEPLACCVLRGAFEATLSAAAILAHQRGSRVKVYLTPLGCGAFGNRRSWLLDAIEAALVLHRDQPLDVFLVHPERVPDDERSRELEAGREPLGAVGEKKDDKKVGIVEGRTKAEEITQAMQQRLQDLQKQVGEKGGVSVYMLSKDLSRLDSNNDGIVDDDELRALVAWTNSNLGKAVKAFSCFDINGDGVIDKAELTTVLQALDPRFFTERTINILLAEADADGDGEIHYTEFVSWLFDEDPEVVNRMMGASKLYDAE
mmetsp:Transcript_14836/g.42009  ORF Transcript_14836/g.42009 Transcript_14836/m.42009 type:complete len:554 (-) Transcript_14836:147-1808(-)